MLRITIEESTSSGGVLRLEGRIAGDDVRLLRREAEHWSDSSWSRLLDLDGVQFIDEQGLELLRCWGADGVTLRGGSIYIRALLTNRGLT